MGLPPFCSGTQLCWFIVVAVVLPRDGAKRSSESGAWRDDEATAIRVMGSACGILGPVSSRSVF